MAILYTSLLDRLHIFFLPLPLEVGDLTLSLYSSFFLIGHICLRYIGRIDHMIEVIRSLIYILYKHAFLAFFKLARSRDLQLCYSLSITSFWTFAM